MEILPAVKHAHPSIQGLCHISEFGTDEQMRKTIETGKTYEFYVQSISGSEHRMALGFGKPKQRLQEKSTVMETVEDKS